VLMRTIKLNRKGAPFYNAFLRWDEKAGLQRDAIRSQRLTRSRRRKGDRLMKKSSTG
jgi:hypothetical protein